MLSFESGILEVGEATSINETWLKKTVTSKRRKKWLGFVLPFNVDQTLENFSLNSFIRMRKLLAQID